MPSLDLPGVEQSLCVVRARIASATPAGKNPGDVTVLAVTKGFGPQAVELAIGAGLRNIGENYYQEAAGKFARVAPPTGIRLHFIGRVQRNKARRIAHLFDVVQTVDDLSVAGALDDAAEELHKTLDILVQVNVAIDQRQGVPPPELDRFLASLQTCAHLRLRGLMAMGPREPAAVASAFARARGCFDALRARYSELDTLSMGMSDDLEIAVAAGATMVRVGSALFGARPSVHP